jgi:hypothetical protein
MMLGASWTDCATIETQVGAPYPAGWNATATATPENGSTAPAELVGLSVGSYALSGRCQSRLNSKAYRSCTFKVGASLLAADSATPRATVSVKAVCPPQTLAVDSSGKPGTAGVDIMPSCAPRQFRSAACAIGETIPSTGIAQDLANQNGTSQWRHVCAPEGSAGPLPTVATATGDQTILTDVPCPSAPGSYECSVERQGRSGAWEGPAFGDPKRLLVSCPESNPRWNVANSTCGLCELPDSRTANSCGATVDSMPRQNYASGRALPSGHVCLNAHENSAPTLTDYRLTCGADGGLTVTCASGDFANRAPSVPPCGRCLVQVGSKLGTCRTEDGLHDYPYGSYAPVGTECPEAVVATQSVKLRCTTATDNGAYGWVVYF